MPPVRPALYVVILDSGCNRIPDRCFAPGPLLPSKTGLLLVSASVEEDLLADMATVLQTDTGIERHVHRADGPAWFLVRILPYHSQDKTVTGVGITFVDITDISRGEEAERRYGELLQLSHDAIFVWLLDGNIETWNRGGQELYGFSVEQARGQAPLRLLKTAFPLPFADVAATLRGTGHWEGELEQRTMDGRAITVSSKLLLMRGEDGVDRVLESNRDITENKAAEAERERLIEALRAADQRKDQFLAMLSHELRNPLAPIWNSLAILDRAPHGGDQAQRAEAVLKRQITQLTRIVDDLLDVTRVSHGKLQVKRRPIELGDLVQSTVEDQRLTILNAGLELEMRAAKGPLWIDGDPVRLAQALGNVLSNAAKFTSRGGHVLVALEEAAGMAIVRVRDDGAGIHPDLLARVFEPFEQADRTLARSRGGLGLGLALVKGLVEQHGGDVQAASDGPGKGTEVTIRLPLAKAPPAEASATTNEHLHGTRRILVIEDNVDAADSLRDALMLYQHEVAVAYRGAEGLDKARAFKPDVVLCDIGLPEMDGYQVARAMRADDQLRRVQLIALTGYALPQDIAKAKEAGFDQHLAKPPNMEKLVEVLQRSSADS
jgi:two-component system CheB/CheR fusion protein